MLETLRNNKILSALLLAVAAALSAFASQFWGDEPPAEEVTAPAPEAPVDATEAAVTQLPTTNATTNPESSTTTATGTTETEESQQP